MTTVALVLELVGLLLVVYLGWSWYQARVFLRELRRYYERMQDKGR